MEPPPQNSQSWITPSELTALLNELHEPESRLNDHDTEFKEDHVTVSSVAEATGYSEDDVAETLLRLRQEDEEIRLAHVLRELEAPYIEFKDLATLRTTRWPTIFGCDQESRFHRFWTISPSDNSE